MEHWARFEGRIRFSGLQVDTVLDDVTGLMYRRPTSDGHIEIVGDDGRVLQRVAVRAGDGLYVDEGDAVSVGARLTLWGRIGYRDRPFQHLRSGAARFAALLEAHHPRCPAVLARFDGRLVPTDERTVDIGAEDGRVQHVGQRFLCLNDERVEVGEALSDGERDHHELLALWGRERFESHLVEELDEVLSTSGLNIVPAALDLIARDAVVDTPEGPRLRPLGEFPDRSDE